MGETFGKYQLIEKIGKGGMAEVYLATLHGDLAGFEKRVALKMMSENLSDHEDLVIMFLDEARIAAQLNHPNIVHVYDLGRVDDTLYIAMEYVEGRDLRRICERGLDVDNFLPLEFAARIIAEAAAGLHYAHGSTDSQGQPRNVVHRDVTPQNILVSLDGQVKVADFGVAKAEDRLGHTRLGQRKGKLSYMSPEQFEADNVDARSDVYALGILLYETTVQTRLFRGRSDFETMSLIANSKVTPPHEIRPDFPLALEAIIMRALQKDLSARYQSAQELQVALEDWLHARPQRVGAAELGEYMRGLFPEMLHVPAPQVASANPVAQAVVAPASGSDAPLTAATPVGAVGAVAGEVAPAPGHSSPGVLAAPPASASGAPVFSAPAAGAPVAQGAPPAARRASSPPGATSPAALRAAAPGPQARPAPAPAPRVAPDAQPEAPNDPQPDVGEPFDDEVVPEYSNRNTYILTALGLVAAAVVIGVVGDAIIHTKSSLDTSKSDEAKAARALAEKQAAELPAPPKFVGVSLGTEPSGARVVVNGRASDLETPAQFQLVADQVNEVVFYHADFPPQRVLVNGKAGAQLAPTKLVGWDEPPVLTELEVQSDPAGGVVYVDGQRIGEAPQTVKDLAAGVEHHVEVRKDGFWSSAGYFDLVADHRNAYQLTLLDRDSIGARDAVEVTYDVVPEFSSIKVNGEFRGVSRLSTREPRNQLLRVEAEQQYYDAREHYILMHDIGTFIQRSLLRAQPRTLQALTIDLQPRDATLYINANSYQKPPIKLQLASDTYPVVVETSDGQRYEANLRVDAHAGNAYRLALVDGVLDVQEID